MVAQLDARYIRVTKARSLVRLLSYLAFEGRPATTRGQWINPAVFQHLTMALRLRPDSPPTQPIFILGVGRSGTTILGKVLSAHECVGFLNEPKAMWHVIDPREDVSGFYGSEQDGYFVRSASDVTEDMQRRALRLYRYYERISRSRRVVDKYCELTYRREYLRALFPDCTLIGIVRHPASVMTSVAKWSEEHRRSDEDWWGVDDKKWRLLKEQLLPQQQDSELLCSVADNCAAESTRSLLEWIVGTRALLSCSQPALDLLVRYEDLVKDPLAQIERVVTACGLEPSFRTLALATSIRSDSREWEHLEHSPPVELIAPLRPLLGRLGYTWG